MVLKFKSGQTHTQKHTKHGDLKTFVFLKEIKIVKSADINRGVWLDSLDEQGDRKTAIGTADDLGRYGTESYWGRSLGGGAGGQAFYCHATEDQYVCYSTRDLELLAFFVFILCPNLKML